MVASLQPGEPAPEIVLPLDEGGEFSLQARRGEKVVIFFYPKDDTSGCTQEALAFSAALTQFAAAGAYVVGVSRDSLASHAKFRKKHALTAPLASDAQGEASQAYGVWVEKSLYGRKYMGVERSTFLIDASGKLARSWRKVKINGHVDEVLKAVREI